MNVNNFTIGAFYFGIFAKRPRELGGIASPLTHSRSRVFGRDRKSRPLVGNVQQVMSTELRNQAIAPSVLFYTTKRVGGGVQDFDAIKVLKFAVS
jgi:hypothetical protein